MDIESTYPLLSMDISQVIYSHLHLVVSQAAQSQQVENQGHNLSSPSKIWSTVPADHPSSSQPESHSKHLIISSQFFNTFYLNQGIFFLSSPNMQSDAHFSFFCFPARVIELKCLKYDCVLHFLQSYQIQCNAHTHTLTPAHTRAQSLPVAHTFFSVKDLISSTTSKPLCVLPTLLDLILCHFPSTLCTATTRTFSWAHHTPVDLGRHRYFASNHSGSHCFFSQPLPWSTICLVDSYSPFRAQFRCYFLIEVFPDSLNQFTLYCVLICYSQLTLYN